MSHKYIMWLLIIIVFVFVVFLFRPFILNQSGGNDLTITDEDILLYGSLQTRPQNTVELTPNY